MKKRLKINGIIIVLALILLAMFPTLFLRRSGGGLWEEVAEILGIAAILLGQIIRTAARGYKADHSKNGSHLIQGGPYLVVRNPMYLGILFIGIGIILVLFNWWVASIFFGVFLARYIFLIFREEKKLLSSFGQEYRRYCKKVPRLIPSFSTIFNLDIAVYLPLKRAWIKKEGGTSIAVLLGVLIIESWKDILHEGIGEYCKESAATFVIIILFALFVFYLGKRTATFTNGTTTKR
ncbi:MAG: isoprenylcysteine carboxylmethyltransferase family protein [Candidatus Omnitrophica bacterium]|nr:isoprenylcysteine carboxylmethyltransferase family protein [Candidatus Omnitrophota bacterium]